MRGRETKGKGVKVRHIKEGKEKGKKIREYRGGLGN